MNENNLLPTTQGPRIEIPKIKFENISAKPKGKKRVKRKKKVFKRFFTIVMIGLIAFFGYKYYPQISEFLNSNISDSTINTDTNIPTTDTETDKPSSSNQATLPEDTDKSRFQIIVSSPKSFEVINKSSHSIDFTDTSTSFLSVDDIYRRYGSDAPVVLITHLSPSEGYSNGMDYLPSDPFYSPKENVGQLGEEICTILNSGGVNAIHLSKEYNEGTLAGSRKEFEAEIDSILKRYPSISYVLDISRGIYIGADMTVQRPTYDSENGAAAQLSFTVGSSPEEISAEQEENLIFAVRLCELLLSNNKHSVSDLTVSPFPLSQNISPAFVKVSIGEFGNTFEEAMRGARILAETLREFLK